MLMMNVLMILLFFIVFLVTFTAVGYVIDLYKRYKLYKEAYEILINEILVDEISFNELESK